MLYKLKFIVREVMLTLMPLRAASLADQSGTKFSYGIPIPIQV